MSHNEENEIKIEIKSEKEDTQKVSEDVESDESLLEKNETENNLEIQKLNEELSGEQQRSKDLEHKLKRALADFQNLEKKTRADVDKLVNARIDEFMLDFLQIYDDFMRAKSFLASEKIDTKGLDSILKNMDNFMKKNNVGPIQALGEIFDPRFHEAIAIINDPDLDDNTITKEIRKGYISHNRVIRPTLVEISKKLESER